MHVLFVSPWYPSELDVAAGRFVQDQARALGAAGIRVGVIHPDIVSLRTWPELRNRIKLVQKRVIEDHGSSKIPVEHGVGFSWLPKVPYGQSALWLNRARKLYRSYVESYGRPDLIHAHCAMYSGVFAAEIGRREKIPYVLTEHSTAYARGLVRSWQKSMLKRAFQQAKARLIISPMLAKDIGRVLSEDSLNPWIEMPEIVDTEFLANNASFKNSAEKQDFSFFSLALWTPKKGSLDLIRAFAKVARGSVRTRLRVGGGGADVPGMAALAKDLGVAELVDFLGPLNRQQVMREMRDCDSFVSSSLVETFGVVLIEAMASGKPVVATRSGGPDGFVTPQDGILVPISNPDALADGMSRIMAGYSSFDSQDIRRRCLDRFGAPVIASRLMGVYREVLGAAGKGA